MLKLPDRLSIKRDKKGEARLVEKARAWVTKDGRTPGIHASELLDPRKAYWSRVDPKELSNRLVNTFLVGRVLHAFVINAVDGTKSLAIDGTDQGTRTCEELGIEWSPDFFIKGKVRELKTSRAYYEPKTVEDLAMYAEQTLVYMAATNTLEGQVWVLFLNFKDEDKRTSPEWRVYTISITQDDLDQFKQAIKITRKALLSALKVNSDEKLPPCREWLRSKKMCDWWGQCACSKEKDKEKKDSDE